jgi:hypothetical protein
VGSETLSLTFSHADPKYLDLTTLSVRVSINLRSIDIRETRSWSDELEDLCDNLPWEYFLNVVGDDSLTWNATELKVCALARMLVDYFFLAMNENISGAVH